MSDIDFLICLMLLGGAFLLAAIPSDTIDGIRNIHWPKRNKYDE